MSSEAQIRYAVTTDGVHIAYANVGEGFPLVVVPGWVSNLEDQLAERAPPPGIRLVLYDKRGTGLSDRGLDDYSVETRVRDLEAVVASLGLDRFAIFGESEGGPIAMLYTGMHPERVAGLLLYGTYANGTTVPPDVHAAIGALARADWGLASTTLMSLFAPGCTHEEAEGFATRMRQGADAADGVKLWDELPRIDVRPVLTEIQCPTFVVHVRGDRIVPFERARTLARSIPHARFIPIAGERHLAGPNELPTILQAFGEFLSEVMHREGLEGREAAQALQQGFRTILFTDVVSSTPLLSQLGDVKMRAVMRDHDVVLAETVKQHGGRVIKMIGDAFMAEFAVPSAAVEAAIDAQRAIRETFAASDVPVRVRIGINAGEPIEEGGDLHGASVVIAKRLESAADANGILVSDVVKQAVAGKEFAFEDRGLLELKGFEEPVRAWAVKWE